MTQNEITLKNLDNALEQSVFINQGILDNIAKIANAYLEMAKRTKRVLEVEKQMRTAIKYTDMRKLKELEKERDLAKHKLNNLKIIA